jgi:hypothetical protein
MIAKTMVDEILNKKNMYNSKDIQFVGKYDYDKSEAEKFSACGGKSFSVGIFKWELKSSGKEMKRGATVVRVHGAPDYMKYVFETVESIIRDLDRNEWVGKKNIFIKKGILL